MEECDSDIAYKPIMYVYPTKEMDLTIKLKNDKLLTHTYPKYNDSWNIAGLQNQDNPKLFIYDRYGKLIKQLIINSDGWDGTFNGQPLPTDDYWFVITYLENGIAKEYRSHFSLIR